MERETHSPCKRKERMKMKKKNEEKNICFDVKKIRIPLTISFTGQNTENSSRPYNPDMLFAITVPQDVKISNRIGGYLRKHNVFDCSCLHSEPDEAALDRALASSLLYKTELGDCSKTATVTLVCGKTSEHFFTSLKQSGYPVIECGAGIYRIHMTALIETYVVVMEELEEDKRHWMESLIEHVNGECREIHVNCPDLHFHVIEI